MTPAERLGVAPVRVLDAAEFSQRHRMGMQLLSGRPGGLSNRDHLQLYTGEKPLDALAKELDPHRPSLMIVHQQRVHDQLARYAESVELPVDLAAIVYGR